jgi:hypothetical protein
MTLQFGSRFRDMTFGGVADFRVVRGCFSTTSLRSFAPPGPFGFAQGRLARHPSPRELRGSYSSVLVRRSELVITETELKLMAAAAKIGLNSNPKNG